jgi:multiple sugar transport system permease protein
MSVSERQRGVRGAQRARSAPTRSKSRSFKSWRSRGGLSAIVLALPALFVFAYFAWIPIIRGVIMSFQQTNFVTAATWVGFKNFTFVFHDPLLGTAALNTLWFTVLALVFGFPVPLFLAVFVSELRGRRWMYSVLAYLPVVIPPVAAILLWKTFYDPSTNGLFNSLLHLVGLGPFQWLNSTTWAMPSIVLEATWATAGSTVIIYLAALTSVRTELYEAAELDGAGIWSRVWHITLPQLRGIILIMLLLQIIGTMQVFTEPFVFTGGGPDNATITVLLLIYRYAFIDVNYGAATALSVLLAAVLAIVSGVYLFLTRRLSDR